MFYNCQGGRCERQCPPVLERPVRVLPARELKRLWKPACYTSGRQGWKWSVKLAENFADTLVWSGTGNAMVRYRIVEGDTGGNFSIDSVTGEVGWMIMIDIKWLCSFRFLTTFNLMFVILSSMSCENVKRFTDHMDFKSGSTNWSSWLRTDSRKGNRKGARCNSSRSSDKCFDSLTTRFTTWPSERSIWGHRHSTLMSMSASLSSTRTITRQRCCFVFSLHHLNRRHDFLSSKPTNTGWTSRKTPLGAPLFCR